VSQVQAEVLAVPQEPQVQRVAQALLLAQVPLDLLDQQVQVVPQAPQVVLVKLVPLVLHQP